MDVKRILPVVLIVLLASACHKDNGPCLTCPPPYTQSILLDTLSIEPAAVVFQVSTRDSTHLGAVQLYRDSVSVFSKTIVSIDTTIIDTSLLPLHHYRYKAFRLMGNTPIDSSAAIVLTTMDTTSHNFTWEIDTLGEVESSWLNDVAIINDTLAYAVGEIYVAGQPYNIARWDGHAWNLSTLNFIYDYGTGYAQAVAVYAFGPTDVLVSAGASVMHWNGQHWTNLDYLYHSQGNILIGSVYRMWGTSVNDLYGVGLQGSILHWDGMNWQTIASGTTLDIQDIWGATDTKTGDQQIICVVSNKYTNSGMELLRISGGSAGVISDNGLPWSLSGIWFLPGKYYWVVGDGVYRKRFSIATIPWQGGANIVTTHYTFGVRGNDINDLVATGGQGEIVHFNGSTWTSYFASTRLGYGNYYSVAIRGNLIVAVGEDSPRGAIAIGKRNPAK